MQQKLNTDLIRLWVEPATRESNNALYPQVAAGNKDAREQMIQANMGLVITKVEHFLAFLPKFRYLRDDLIANGFVGLIEAVNLMAEQGVVQDFNPTGLIGMKVQRAIGTNTIEAHDETINVPTRSRNRHNLPVPRREINLSNEAELFSGGGMERPDLGVTREMVEQLGRDNDEDEETGDQRVLGTGGVTTHAVQKMAKLLSYDPRRMQSLRETLDACCENEMEREILRLRESGYVDREIADLLDLPLTTTYVMRRTMYARFLELTGWKGEA